MSPLGRFKILLVDPPWPYYGSTTKDAAAGKHYDLMPLADICALDVRGLCDEPAALFLWATGPRLHYALAAMRAWGFHYRGIAFVWVKTRADGGIISGQGVPPTFTKPNVELLLAGTTNKRGRPFPLQDFGMGQVVLHGRGRHSEKPGVFRDKIVGLCGAMRSKTRSN